MLAVGKQPSEVGATEDISPISCSATRSSSSPPPKKSNERPCRQHGC